MDICSTGNVTHVTQHAARQVLTHAPNRRTVVPIATPADTPKGAAPRPRAEDRPVNQGDG